MTPEQKCMGAFRLLELLWDLLDTLTQHTVHLTKVYVNTLILIFL